MVDLISAVEKLQEPDFPSINFNPGRCLRTQDKYSTCKKCVDVCPIQVIRPGAPPEFNGVGCVECLACLSACPTGAFTAEDELQSLLICLARVRPGPVEILCRGNPQTELAIAAEATAIRTSSCLAGIGAGGYLAMAAVDVGQIFIHNEWCGNCAFAPLADQIEHQIEQANQILEALNHPVLIRRVSAESPQAYPMRKIWDTHNPPFSRRDFLRVFSTSGKVALARSLTQEYQNDVRQPSKDHRSAVSAIRRLINDLTNFESRLESLSFASLKVSSACTACGACERACPNAALTLVLDEQKLEYMLVVKPADCNGCEVCIHVCEPQCIKINHAPALKEIFISKKYSLLSQGDLLRCQRCGQLFSPENNVTLCPVCEYRRSNPFGAGAPSRLRPS